VSEQDELQLIGRLSLKVGTLKKRAAFLREELEHVVKAFDALVTDLRHRTNTVGSYRSGQRPVQLQEYASKYSDLSNLMELIKEQDETERQLAIAKDKLAELGGA